MGGLELTRDGEFCQGGGRMMLLDVLRPEVRAEARQPAALWVHGGGWRSGDKASGIRHLLPLAQAGFFTASVSYRFSSEAPFQRRSRT